MDCICFVAANAAPKAVRGFNGFGHGLRVVSMATLKSRDFLSLLINMAMINFDIRHVCTYRNRGCQ